MGKDISKTKKGDCIELEFTGKTDGKVFDSNVKEDLKEIDPKAEPQKLIIFIGQGMVVQGLDKALEEKEVGTKNEVHISYKEGYGMRKRELVKTIPLSVFTKHKINPYAGQTLVLDQTLAKVIAVSGARVITDFNNPLANKDLDFTFTIKRIVTDDKEKASAFFTFFFKFVPKFSANAEKVVIKDKKPVEAFVGMFKDRFKELVGKELEFTEEKDANNPGEKT